MIKKVLHTKKKNGSLKNSSLKGSLRNPKWFFYGITAKLHLKNIVFNRADDVKHISAHGQLDRAQCIMGVKFVFIAKGNTKALFVCFL